MHCVQPECMVGPKILEVLGFVIKGPGKIQHLRELTMGVGMND